MYYQKDKFTETLYSYDSASDKWELVDSISVNGDAAKEQSWRDKFLNQVVKKIKAPAISNPGLISNSWVGTFNIDMNADHAEWRDMQKISLIVTKDSILYHAEGYQIDQTYVLSGTDNGATLQLKYKSAKDNSESAVLDKTKDFGSITKNKDNYVWTCPYLDVSFGDGKVIAHRLTKR